VAENAESENFSGYHQNLGYAQPMEMAGEQYKTWALLGCFLSISPQEIEAISNDNKWRFGAGIVLNGRLIRYSIA
jgi:hypothetical protein